MGRVLGSRYDKNPFHLENIEVNDDRGPQPPPKGSVLLFFLGLLLLAWEAYRLARPEFSTLLLGLAAAAAIYVWYVGNIFLPRWRQVRDSGSERALYRCEYTLFLISIIPLIAGVSFLQSL